VSSGLASMAVFAADLSCAHLCDDKAYRSVCSVVRVKCCSSLANIKPPKVSAMLQGCFLSVSGIGLIDLGNDEPYTLVKLHQRFE
jgi:hypothetical protein